MLHGCRQYNGSLMLLSCPPRQFRGKMRMRGIVMHLARPSHRGAVLDYDVVHGNPRLDHCRLRDQNTVLAYWHYSNSHLRPDRPGFDWNVLHGFGLVRCFLISLCCKRILNTIINMSCHCQVFEAVSYFLLHLGHELSVMIRTLFCCFRSVSM